MPMIQADDGARLYAESTGSGTPMSSPGPAWACCPRPATPLTSRTRPRSTARSTASWRRSTAARGGSAILAPCPPPPPAWPA